MQADSLNRAGEGRRLRGPEEASGAAAGRRSRLVAGLVDSDELLRQAQALRHDIFQAEYGVVFDSADGLDQDAFDAHCRHLVVREAESGRVVATTRLLSSEQAVIAGGYYSEAEFDLQSLKAVLTGPVLEIGRTCVHPDYRQGSAITLLWSALAELLVRDGYAYLMGCASIGLSDGGALYASLMPRLLQEHLVDPAYRVQPRLPVPEQATGAVSMATPPLLKAYMRMGAQICGPACWDPAFDCADIFVLLDVSKLVGKYASRFIDRVAC